MKTIFTTNLIVIAFCLILSGCNRLSKDQALQEFKAEHPTVTLVKYFVGEGDGDHAYFHFQYLEADSKEISKAIWLYQKQQNGNWKVIKKKSQNQSIDPTRYNARRSGQHLIPESGHA